MTRSINRAVVEHLVDIQHRDLIRGDVTPRLVAAAAEAIADVLLDLGYQLERSYFDGIKDIVHCYINPRTGEILEEVGFSLGLINSENGGPNLAAFLRLDSGHPTQPAGFGEPLRSARYWYLPMSDSTTAIDVIAAVAGNYSEAVFEWRAAA